MALEFAGQQVAIITDRIRKQMLQTIFDEAGDSDTSNYYILVLLNQQSGMRLIQHLLQKIKHVKKNNSDITFNQ